MSEWQWVINIGATGVLGTVSWFVRGLVARQDKTALELTDLRLKVAQDYVTHAALREIRETLVRIEGKIDQKADK